jgi:hypothetical protein
VSIIFVDALAWMPVLPPSARSHTSTSPSDCVAANMSRARSAQQDPVSEEEAYTVELQSYVAALAADVRTLSHQDQSQRGK